MVTQQKDLNILLLGQTGTGKSTFINAFYNYLSYTNIEEALHAESIKYCVPIAFDCYDDEDERYHIVINRHENTDECLDIGKSATQFVKSYLFKFNNLNIRIIDTPGFGDTEGIEKDEEICENLLNFLSLRDELHDLHGIIFLLKPNDNRMTNFFKYCLDQIFSKLHRNACENIIFVFTHTKGTNYKPGPSLSLLNSVISEFHGRIQSKENIFCFENDCIRYLYASLSNSNFILDNNTKNICGTDWRHSTTQLIRTINYIKTLNPHSVQETVAINATRHLCKKLGAQLPIMSKQITKNVDECQACEKKEKVTEKDIEELNSILYTSTTVKRDGKYHLVCHNHSCKLKEVYGKNKKPCCVDCRAVSMALCYNINYRSICKNCQCNKRDHVFIKKDDHKESNHKKYESIEKNMKSKQEVQNTTKLSLFNLRIMIKKIKIEQKYIDQIIRKLQEYLRLSAIMSDQRHEPHDSNTEAFNNEDLMASGNIDQILTNLKKLEVTGGTIETMLKNENLSVPEDNVLTIDREM